MTYRGHIENGQILLDEPATLPDGADVTIELVGSRLGPSGRAHSVLDIAPVSLGKVIRPLDSDDDILGEMLEERL